MIRKSIILFSVSLVLLLSGCKKEKATRTIVDIADTPAASHEPNAMEERKVDKSFTWGNEVCRCVITRTPDRDIVIKDADGNMYYDNNISLSVEGTKGIIIDKVYSKDDFTPYIDTKYLKPKRSALMSIAFSHVSQSEAVFVVTVGSPEEMDDEFMYVRLSLTKSGTITMSRLQDVDNDDNAAIQ